MTIEGHLAALPTPTITIADHGVHITGLFVDDPLLAEFLSAYPPQERVDELTRILSVGVRGMTAMGVGATVKTVSEEIEKLLAAAANEHTDRLREVIESGRRSLAGTLDPAVRSSLAAKAVAEIESAHGAMLARLDPDLADSHSSRLVSELTSLLGPEGLLRERLSEIFDANDDGSAMSRVVSAVDARFRELRDLIVGARSAADEAARGTAKGAVYEDAVVASLRSVAAEIGGCTVEATGSVTGALDSSSKVGDALLRFEDGTGVVVEAKNVGRISLTGKSGILEELDRAMVNRDATWAVCVSRDTAYPAEVGAFGIYGNRILLADDGEGVLLRVALRWIRACATASSEVGGVDTEALRSTISRIRRLAQRFSGAKRALSGVRSSVDQVRTEIDALRTDLLDLVADLSTAIGSPRHYDGATGSC